MSRLTASLVVDLVDKTGAKTQAIIGNMDRLKRAERDYMLADRGARLSSRDRALERMMMERQAADEARRQKMMLLASRIGTGVAIGGVMAAKAYTNFADLERRVNRIVINADKGAGAIDPTIRRLQQVADQTRTSFDEVVGGLEALVASGRSLDESLAFLPAVALTAQASGAAMNDVALTADAMSSSLKINADEMQRAFDILVAGGKAGKFELKDMAQYLPSLLPAMSAMGYEGTEGLQKVVAMLQVMRNQAGSSSDAATYLGNVLNKVYSEETASKFKKMGVDLPGALAKAKKEGRDVLDVFLDMTMIATKGDLSKLPKLFTDAEFQKGMRALIMQRPELEAMVKSLGNVDGTALKDFGQIAEDSAAKIQKLSNLWDKFVTQVGGGVATVANPTLEYLTKEVDDFTARLNAKSAFPINNVEDQRKEGDAYKARYRQKHPDAWFWQVNEAYMDAQAKVGRGEQATVFDELSKASVGRQNQKIPRGMPTPRPRPQKNAFGLYDNPYRYGNGHEEMMAAQGRMEANATPVPLDKAAEGFMDFHGLVEAGSTASDKIAEGGGKAGQKAAETMQAGASGIGAAIAQSFLAKVQGSLGALLANAGGGRPTGQVVKEQANGQFVDP